MAGKKGQRVSAEIGTPCSAVKHETTSGHQAAKKLLDASRPIEVYHSTNKLSLGCVSGTDHWQGSEFLRLRVPRAVADRAAAPLCTACQGGSSTESMFNEHGQSADIRIACACTAVSSQVRRVRREVELEAATGERLSTRRFWSYKEPLTHRASQWGKVEPRELGKVVEQMTGTLCSTVRPIPVIPVGSRFFFSLLFGRGRRCAASSSLCRGCARVLTRSARSFVLHVGSAMAIRWGYLRQIFLYVEVPPAAKISRRSQLRL